MAAPRDAATRRPLASYLQVTLVLLLSMVAGHTGHPGVGHQRLGLALVAWARVVVGGGGGRMDAWTKGQPGGTRAHTAGRQAGRRAVLEIWSRLTARARKAPSHPRTHRQDGRGGRAHKCNAPLLARGCRGQAAAGEQGMGGQRAVAPASACAARQHPGSSGCSSLSTAEKADLQSQSSPTGIRSRGAPLWCLCGLPPAGTRRQRAAAAGIPRSQCSHASRPLAAPPPSLALPPVHPTSRIRSVRR